MGLLDDFFYWFSPAIAADREKSRLLADAYRKERSFEGASNSRRTSGWKTSSKGPNAELGPALHKLRDRSRDLFQNNPSTQKAIGDLTNYVIGTGIRPTFYETKVKSNKQTLESTWKKVFEKPKIDFEGKLNVYGIQWLGFHTIALSGEVIIRVRRNKKGFPFSLQVFECDIIDTNKDGIQLKNGSSITQGIQYDADGRVEGYWLFASNPNENNLGYSQSKYIAAVDANGIPNVLHYFITYRPGQGRGYPMGVSAFIRIKDLDEFEDAELIKQKIGSAHAAFVQRGQSDTSLGITTDSNGDPIERFAPGMVYYLQNGEEITFNNPPTKDGYSDYTKDVKRTVSAGYNVPYELLTGDYSNANFSSLKAGFTPFHKFVEHLQETLIIGQMCSDIVKIFLWGCQLQGLIKIKEEDPTDEFEVSWTPPALPFLDPVKEVKAIEAELRAGLRSWSDALRSRGYDPDQTLKEMIEDNKKLDSAGLMLTSDPRYDPNRNLIQPTDSKEVTSKKK